MKAKNHSLNYAPKEALKIVNRYIPHTYNCLPCCRTVENEEISEKGKDSLQRLKQDLKKLEVPIHLKSSFFSQHGAGVKDKAIHFNISRTIQILQTAQSEEKYPELPNNCRTALAELKTELEQKIDPAKEHLLSAREPESYQEYK